MKSQTETRSCDTLIIGASMAGACLARQLKLKHPEMDIVVLDRKTTFDYWVGESTLESFWDYAVKCLDLGYYLDTSHLYKHGLRFFYDSPEHDLPIAEMSEVGRSWFHTTPAHQLDRKRFDTDLYNMNIASGIDVRLGVAVEDVELGECGDHLVTASDGSYRCRWLVDAAGMSSPIARKKSLVRFNKDTHPINSYWGRFKNIANLDLLGDMNWRSKVNHTTRTLATTHFMYGGYWMWLIPIDRETYSIGLTVKTDMAEITIANQDEFIAFLRTHECMRQLITEQSELVDFKKMLNISRQSQYAFSASRWFLTGMSVAILDPMLSPGSALLADHNRMIGDLIETDMKGEGRVFENKVKAYNAYSKMWQENFFLHIKGHYHDCFDRQRAFFETLLMQWFGIVLPISMVENWGYDPTMSDEDFDMMDQKVDKMLAESCIHKLDTIIEDFHHYLKERGVEYANNRGQFYDIEIGDEEMYNTRTMGRHLSPDNISQIEAKMVKIGLTRCLTRMAELEDIDTNPQMVMDVAGHALERGMKLMEAFQMLNDRCLQCVA